MSKFSKWALLLALTVSSSAYPQWLPQNQQSGPIYYTGGNVGIGTTSPAGALDVAGYVLIRSGSRLRFPTAGFSNHAEIYSPTGEGTGLSPLAFVVGGGEALRISNSRYIGVGTPTPVSPLHVLASIGNSGLGSLRLTRADTSAENFIRFDRGGVSDWILGTDDHTGAANNFQIIPGTGNPVVDITPAGNVGLGTSNPTVRLEVVGDLKVTGNVSAKYQDIAEWVDSSEDAPVGAVVVLDRRHANTVRMSSSPYDTGVAGVVTNAPGVVLGEGGAGKVMVATTGRVRVKAHAHVPIAIGDLLVTSGIAGAVMKSQPISLHGVSLHRPGTIVGKALENLAAGEGEILVLLSLQ